MGGKCEISAVGSQLRRCDGKARWSLSSVSSSPLLPCRLAELCQNPQQEGAGTEQGRLPGSKWVSSRVPSGVSEEPLPTLTKAASQSLLGKSS